MQIRVHCLPDVALKRILLMQVKKWVMSAGLSWLTFWHFYQRNKKNNLLRQIPKKSWEKMHQFKWRNTPLSSPVTPDVHFVPRRPTLRLLPSLQSILHQLLFVFPHYSSHHITWLYSHLVVSSDKRRGLDGDQSAPEFTQFRRDSSQKFTLKQTKQKTSVFVCERCRV